MKANELRLGNWIIINGKHKQIIWIKEQNICAMNGYPSCIKNIEDIQPLPLTEEVLLKCGFKKVDNSANYFFKKGMSIWKCNEMFLCDKNGVIIKSLHQLQNLYFALTGQELKIEF